MLVIVAAAMARLRESKARPFLILDISTDPATHNFLAP